MDEIIDLNIKGKKSSQINCFISLEERKVKLNITEVIFFLKMHYRSTRCSLSLICGELIYRWSNRLQAAKQNVSEPGSSMLLAWEALGLPGPRLMPTEGACG